jgi:hypothetical protein
LELRHQNPKVAAKVIQLFQQGLAGGATAADQATLESFLDQGLTRGHFYRGVE